MIGFEVWRKNEEKKESFLFCEFPKLYCTVTGLIYSCILSNKTNNTEKSKENNNDNKKKPHNFIYPEHIIWVSAFINIIIRVAMAPRGPDNIQYVPQLDIFGQDSIDSRLSNNIGKATEVDRFFKKKILYGSLAKCCFTGVCFSPLWDGSDPDDHL